MSATATRRPSCAGQPAAGRRIGHVAAVVANGVFLWIVHHVVEWGWPEFITSDFDDLVPVMTVSLVAGMVANACFVVYDRGRFRGGADLVTAVIDVVVTVRFWQVFPFDFDGGFWTAVFRVLLVVGIVGTTVRVVTSLGRLATGADRS